jgi:hypothetical protein
MGIFRIGVLKMSKKMTLFISDKIKCKSLHHTATVKCLSLLPFCPLALFFTNHSLQPAFSLEKLQVGV